MGLTIAVVALGLGSYLAFIGRETGVEDEQGRSRFAAMAEGGGGW